jgi:general secretion pathway protein A
VGIYEAYYNCRREPFSLSPDPRFLYLAPSHREALAQLRYMVEGRKGFAVLTGEVGLGKTTLLRSLLERVGPKVHTGYIFNPPRSVPELYASIGAELDLNLDHLTSPINELNQFLLKTFRSGSTVALIFDEAQRLSIDTLEEIRLLSNLETPTAKLLQVILAGQPELDILLDSVGLRALRQRIVMRHSLSPLGAEDTINYIANRVRVAGAKRSPFTLSACRSVYSFSRGVPRLINLICDNAMLSGYAADSPQVDRRRVEMVARELRLETPRRAAIPSRSRNIGDEGHSRITGLWRRFARTLVVAGLGALIIVLAAAAVLACHLYLANKGPVPSSFAEPGARQLGAFVERSIATMSCSGCAFSRPTRSD